MAQAACILGCEGPRLGRDEAAFFAGAEPWGFILFARNVESPDQLRRLTGDLRAALGREAPVLVDQEGGRVQRLGAPHWRQWRPPLDQVQAAGPGCAPRSMELRARLIAHELREAGIDVNCAPSGDIAEDVTHAFLRNRCYGTTVAGVTAVARAVAEGLAAGGVLPVMKHLPGHGRSALDTHLALPAVDAARTALQAHEFAPFKALSDLPMAMTAHIVFSAYDDRPATQSPRLVAAIRDEIGFGGLLMTDDISMQALGGDVAARARLALAAGCDLVLHCNGDMAEMEAVTAACGALEGSALDRADAALAARRPAAPLDIDAAEAELAALLDGHVYG